MNVLSELQLLAERLSVWGRGSYRLDEDWDLKVFWRRIKGSWGICFATNEDFLLTSIQRPFLRRILEKCCKFIQVRNIKRFISGSFEAYGLVILNFLLLESVGVLQSQNGRIQRTFLFFASILSLFQVSHLRNFQILPKNFLLYQS